MIRAVSCMTYVRGLEYDYSPFYLGSLESIFSHSLCLPYLLGSASFSPVIFIQNFPNILILLYVNWTGKCEVKEVRKAKGVTESTRSRLLLLARKDRRRQEGNLDRAKNTRELHRGHRRVGKS